MLSLPSTAFHASRFCSNTGSAKAGPGAAMAVAHGWLWHCSQKSRLTRSLPQPLRAGSTGVRTGVCTTTATAATATGVDGLARPRSATTSASDSFVHWLICTAHTPAWFNELVWGRSLVALPQGQQVAVHSSQCAGDAGASGGLVRGLVHTASTGQTASQPHTWETFFPIHPLTENVVPVWKNMFSITPCSGSIGTVLRCLGRVS